MSSAKINIKPALLLLGSFFLLLFIAFGGLPKDTRIIEYINLLSKIVTGLMLIVAVFIKWAWKWQIFKKWLVTFPNLQGTWEGYIDSNWVNPKTGKIIKRIPVVIVIKHNFLNLSIKMVSSEMVSRSFAECIIIDEDRQLRQLIYSFITNPNRTLTDRSKPAFGSVILDINLQKKMSLSGGYWTDRGTIGDMSAEFVRSKPREVSPEDLDHHPMNN